MLTLSFSKPHLSTTQFPTIALPDFTLITGPNGVGKSHLLQAICNGAVQTDVVPGLMSIDYEKIRLFDWSSMIPQDSGVVSNENLESELINILNFLNNFRNNSNLLEGARNFMRSQGIFMDYISDPRIILKLDKSALASHNVSEHDLDTYISRLKEIMSLNDTQILMSMDLFNRSFIRKTASHLNLPILALTDDDIMSPKHPYWGGADLFVQNFGKLFLVYRNKYIENQLRKLEAQNDKTVEYLSENEFLETFGSKPWEFVNKTFKNADLDFEIDSPDMYSNASYQPKLKKASTGTPVSFSTLSSGEKILMSFAFCVYYSNDSRQMPTRPRILLFDEIDAPLHPAMSKSVIDTITKTLVRDFGIKVIATTHSPSTVALAPEDSIYTMKPGKPGLHKSSKAEALNLLTAGVPTLSISYEGRRQVFVESLIDAEIYDDLYQKIKYRLSSERSLQFLSTGIKSKDGDINSGCALVFKIVGELSKAGNTSTYGLVDWDRTHKPDDRVRVLAFNKRDGLENVLLDPLLLGLTIWRLFPENKEEVGISNDAKLSGLANMQISDFQKVVNAVGEKVFGSMPEEVMESHYFGGLKLSIDQRFGMTDDHRLEGKVLRAFPYLKKHVKDGRGKLPHTVVKHALDDIDFMPMDIVDIMTEFLNAESHPEPA